MLKMFIINALGGKMKLEKEFNEIIKMPKEEQIKLLTNPNFLVLKDKCNYELPNKKQSRRS